MVVFLRVIVSFVRVLFVTRPVSPRCLTSDFLLRTCARVYANRPEVAVLAPVILFKNTLVCFLCCVVLRCVPPRAEHEYVRLYSVNQTRLPGIPMCLTASCMHYSPASVEFAGFVPPSCLSIPGTWYVCILRPCWDTIPGRFFALETIGSHVAHC